MADSGRCAPALAGVLALCAPAAWADEGNPRGFLAVILENDIVAGRDDQYSHGTFLRYSPPPNALPGWARYARDQASELLDADAWWVTYGLGQAMFTPNDITLRNPPLDDRPFAGFLFGTVALSADTGKRLDTLAIDIGVVGPPSLAEQTQKAVHKIMGDDPNGWSTQLNTEVAGRVLYERLQKYGTTLGPEWRGLELDVIPQGAVALGTVDTSLTGAMTVRAGRNLDMDYGPPRVRRSVAGFAAVDSHEDGWYVFASAEGRLVGRNLFLDGNTFRSSRSVDSEALVAEFAVGAAIHIGSAVISYSHVFRSPEFETTSRWTEFGSLSVQIPF